MIKTAVVFGGSYALGSWGGDRIANAIKTPVSSGVRTGIQIGAGVVAFFVLSSVLR